MNTQSTRRPICTECGALSARWYQPLIGTEHFCSIPCVQAYVGAHRHSGETALAIHTEDCHHFTPEGQTADEMSRLACEHTPEGFDTTLRDACGERAFFGAYNKTTLAVEHYVCAEHVSDVPREFGTMILRSADVPMLRQRFGE